MSPPTRAAMGKVLDTVTPVGQIFRLVVSSNVAHATRWNIPAAYEQQLLRYAMAHTDDGQILRSGLARAPVVYQGGWLLDVQKNAIAITLDTAIFFRGDTLDLATWAHELVHVHQFGVSGATAFLTSYFGLSAATVAERLIRRQPMDVMRSSPHEEDAYTIGGRFGQWLAG